MRVRLADQRLVVHDGRSTPWFLWIVGGGFLALAVALPLRELLGTSGAARWLAALGFLPALAIGGMGWLLVRHLRLTAVVLDRASRTVHVRRRGVLAQELLEIPLRDVVRAETVETVDHDGDRFYYLELVLRRGGPVRLSDIGRGRRAGCDRARDAIAAFLEQEARGRPPSGRAARIRTP